MFRPALARCSRATTAIRTRRRDHRRAEGPQPVGRQRGLRPQRQRAGDGDAKRVRPRARAPADDQAPPQRRPRRASGARAHRLDIKLDYLPASTTPRSIATADRPTVRPSDPPGRPAPLVWKTSSCVASAAFHARRSSAVMTRHRDRRPTSTAASRRPTASPTARAWAVCEADVGRSSARAAKSRRDHGRPVRDDVLGAPCYLLGRGKRSSWP
jgi:hypothetical protein